MTEEFKTREQIVRMRISGLEFGVELSEKTADICKAIMEDAKKKLEDIRRKDPQCAASEDDICQFLKESIDKLLGQGSVDRIFGSRRCEIYDLKDLMCYIVSKIRSGFLESVLPE